MRYSTHSKVYGKIKGVQNDLQPFYAIKFQGKKSMNLSLNPGCETSSTLLPNYSFEHATHRAVMLYESLLQGPKPGHHKRNVIVYRSSRRGLISQS